MMIFMNVLFSCLARHNSTVSLIFLNRNKNATISGVSLLLTSLTNPITSFILFKSFCKIEESDCNIASFFPSSLLRSSMNFVYSVLIPRSISFFAILTCSVWKSIVWSWLISTSYFSSKLFWIMLLIWVNFLRKESITFAILWSLLLCGPMWWHSRQIGSSQLSQ